MPITLQAPTVRSVFLSVRVGKTILATATGFLVRRANELFLLTNRHVATGVAQDTGQVLWSKALPDNLLAEMRGADLSRHSVEVPLIDEDQMPLWFEHPSLGHEADVVAVRLPSPDEGVTMLGYDLHQAEPQIRVLPSDMLSIVGYPFGIRAAGLPVWSAGFVASEPQLEYDNRPVFLIDSRTRSGQSGSPVIAHRTGGMVPLDDGMQTTFRDPVTRLMGIYSGRITLESDLGMVWKRSVLQELIDAIPAI